MNIVLSASTKPMVAVLVSSALIALCIAFPGSSAAAEAEYAPLMPLASQSLLLDIDRVGDRLVAVGERGHIIYSDDFGGSWQQAKVPTTRMLTAVCFADDRGWVVGHDGLILVSDDRGALWHKQRDGLAAQQQINLQKRESAHRRVKQLSAAIAASDTNPPPEQIAQGMELQARLRDAQFDLEDAELALQEPVFTPPLMDIWFRDSQRGWAVGAFGTFLSTSDGGEHWQMPGDQLDNPDELHLNAIVGDGAEQVFVAGEEGLMFRSLNGGESWQRLQSPYAGSWFGATYSRQHETLLVFGLRGSLFRSPDFGQNWVPLSTESAMSLSGASRTRKDAQDLLLVGNLGTYLHSLDGGSTLSLHTLSKRVSLSSGVPVGNQLIMVGQGGVHMVPVTTK